MPQVTKYILKSYFQDQDQPTDWQFSDLIDTLGLQSDIDALYEIVNPVGTSKLVTTNLTAQVDPSYPNHDDHVRIIVTTPNDLAIIYYIAGEPYSIASQSTLDLPPLPITENYKRFDLVYVDTAQTLKYLSSVESTEPSQPTLQTGQVAISYFLVSWDDTINSTPLVANQNIIWVGKHGNDDNNGLNWDEQAKLTFTAAITDLNNKDTISQYGIRCHDNGYYTEELITNYNISADLATLNGTLYCISDVSIAINIDTITVDSGSALIIDNAASKVFLKVNKIVGNIEVRSGILYIDCKNHTGTITNNGTIKGKINDTFYPNISSNAAGITTDVTGFGANIPETDINVQMALDTLNNLDVKKVVIGSAGTDKKYLDSNRFVAKTGETGAATLKQTYYKMLLGDANNEAAEYYIVSESHVTPDSSKNSAAGYITGGLHLNDTDFINFTHVTDGVWRPINNNLGSKLVNETALADKTIPYYDNATSKFIFKTPSQLLPDINLGYVTVGATIGMYSTVALAIAALKYNILIVENTTENANINCPNNITVYIKGLKRDVIWDVTGGNYLFSTSVSNINGVTTENLTFNFKRTDTTSFFNSTNSSSYTRFFNCNINDTSTALGRLTGSSQDLLCENCNITLPNLNTCFCNNALLRHCNITGGGSSCVLGNQYTSLDDVRFIGTFSSTQIFSSYGESTVKNIKGTLTSRIGFYTEMSNIQLPNCSLAYGGSDDSYSHNISNFKLKDLFTDNGGDTAVRRFTDGWFTGAVTFSRTIAMVNNVRFVGNVIINTPGVCVFTNCKFEGSITVNANSNASFYNCVGTSVTFNAIYSAINGGQWTTIISNANYCSVQNVMKSTSISVNAANIGNIITGNHCDTDITIVTGNEYNNNIIY